MFHCKNVDYRLIPITKYDSPACYFKTNCMYKVCEQNDKIQVGMLYDLGQQNYGGRTRRKSNKSTNTTVDESGQVSCSTHSNDLITYSKQRLRRYVVIKHL